MGPTGRIALPKFQVGRSDNFPVILPYYNSGSRAHVPYQLPIFKAEDEIMEKRDSLIELLERRLAQHTATEALFTIRWAVV